MCSTNWSKVLADPLLPGYTQNNPVTLLASSALEGPERFCRHAKVPQKCLRGVLEVSQRNLCSGACGASEVLWGFVVSWGCPKCARCLRAATKVP